MNGQPVHEMAGPFSNMNGYCYFILGILVLAAGYFTYGRVLERIFRPDASRQTPAVACTDGVDYVVMPRWRVFLIQLLNIAGLGPIFGAVMGVLYGPAALLWIVFGCILGGMAHDYFSGMISLRHKGENLPEILGRYLGSQAQWISRAVCIVFSVLGGVVFAVGPAAILSPMTGWSVSAWVWIIFGYYFLATILPIQAIMGKVYPLFSVALIIMVMGILGVMLLAPFADSMPAWMHLPRMEVLPDLDFFHNRHPADFPLFPVMFITIACGAVSGFHATQSPLMARCLKTEREGLPVFGGAMITEGIIAFIWAAAALTFYGSPEALGGATANGKAPALAIQTISESWMGSVGSILVMIGVVILPISTGDGALRVTRLMIADCFKLSQEQLSRRLMIAIPLFAAAIAVSSMDYAVIWQYFGWANQLLAAATLWAVSIYLRSKNRCCWPAAAPAAFLSLVVFQYLFSSPEMCGFSEEASLIARALLTAVIGVLCLFRGSGLEKADEPSL